VSYPAGMKLRLALVTSIYLALVSVLHVGWNIGWAEFRDDVRATLGWERPTIHVGFLPVT